MNTRSILRPLAVALALAAGSASALAEGDIYSRLMDMQAMDRNGDGMISKEEFLAMIAKAWDTHSLEIKVKGKKMTPEQLKQLEKILGRTLGAQADL
ncbi:MAG: hypothetical protein KF788_08060 [Piscinibacter sp.]|nr:hypothetical protein [Piscinibacter sp.]